MTVLGLSVLGCALGVLAWDLTSPLFNAAPPPWGTMLAAIVAALLVIAWQHFFIFENHDNQPDDDWFAARWFTGTPLLMLIGGVQGLMAGSMYLSIDGPVLIRFVLVSIVAPLLVGVLSPGVIDRWNGGDLLFPSQWQLSRHRLFLAVGAAVVSVVLGCIMSLISRATLGRVG